MKEDNPDMKIIFVLRHPIERLIAHYQELFSINATLVRVIILIKIIVFIFLTFFIVIYG